jgi:hypothetical protein
MKKLVAFSISVVACAVLTAVAQNVRTNNGPKDLRLIVVDNNGAEVGTLIDFNGQVPDDLTRCLAFVIINDGRVAPFNITTEAIERGNLFYQSTNCTGTPFIKTDLQRTLLPRTVVNGDRQTLFIEQVGAIPDTTTLLSIRDFSGVCFQANNTGVAVPVRSSGVNFRNSVPPFTVSLAP